MANTKVFASGTSVSVWFALPNYAASPSNPTAAEINATQNVTASVAWDSYSFGASASNQNSDPSFIDVGNTKIRGFSQFGGSISFFYPNNYTDNTDVNVLAFTALKAPRTLGYLIMRVDGLKTTSSIGDVNKAAVTGDFVYIYKVMSDGWADVNVGEVDFKYSITFQPQGYLWANAFVGTVTLLTPVAIGATAYSHLTPGNGTPLGTYYTGRQLAAVTNFWNGTPSWFLWSSSDSTKATVDRNGVVKAVAAGSVTITATDPTTGVASTGLAITIT